MLCASALVVVQGLVEVRHTPGGMVTMLAPELLALCNQIIVLLRICVLFLFLCLRATYPKLEKIKEGKVGTQCNH